MIFVRPFSSKSQGVIEACSHLGMVVIFGFVVLLYFRGNAIEERSLMNVGYGMMAIILLNVAFNVAFAILSSLVGLIIFCRSKLKRRTSPLKEL